MRCPGGARSSSSRAWATPHPRLIGHPCGSRPFREPRKKPLRTRPSPHDRCASSRRHLLTSGVQPYDQTISRHSCCNDRLEYLLQYGASRINSGQSWRSSSGRAVRSVSDADTGSDPRDPERTAASLHSHGRSDSANRRSRNQCVRSANTTGRTHGHSYLRNNYQPRLPRHNPTGFGAGRG